MESESFCKKKISLVIPAYNEEKNIPILISRLENLEASLSKKFDIEYVVLDNNSHDGTRQLILNQCQKNPRWKYVRYSRNFGAEASLIAGLDYATGDAVITLFSDLQDPPENIPEMISKWENGAEVVYGILKERNDSNLVKTLGAKIAYWLIYHLTDCKIPPNATDFRLLDRKVVDSLRTMREPDRYFRGLVHWVGFKQDSFQYSRQKRVFGKSTAGVLYCINFTFNAITCFSSKPLKVILFLGAFLTLVSVLASFVYLFLFFARPSFLAPPPPGITTLILLGVFGLGMNAFFLGIIGEYVGKIYNQGKSRPLYIVSEELNV